MPTPARTDRDAIVAAACALLEEGGTDAVTMQAVAERVGVRSPSLYKHVANRRALLDLVVGAAVADLDARSGAARGPEDARRSITAQVEGLRRFARERPRAWALVMGIAPDGPQPTTESAEASVRSLLEAVAELTGPEHALDGARLVVAWANGFIAMELAGAHRLGGDLDGAWRWGLDRMVDALGSDRAAG
ncbi:TetR/AcrR family transcriptional regulator [Amnibacterium kyonggiense]|uniref:TetR family transcriptional regulator n=1 Tax=Amnibacterium kyonggiense TaxID=595671 RepID=A0A4R7FJD9_9MICO|nr:TetR/AcrR family transcriptional regulator [Amnibacterium kyonggiense]TDS76197.1 TetR family transcriptional regulator [Amnibacterium kyonggiense]